MDAVRPRIDYTDPQSSQGHKLNSRTAVKGVRAAARAGTCRRKHVLIDGRPMSSSLFDSGLYFFL
jgi:aerobic-type carbon monoxide dehydrogenase small subunit (CoxS/CutS family)